MNVTYYDGFAILAINPVNTTIDDALISESYHGLHKYNYPVRYGSGMLLLFTDRFDSLNALSCTVFIRRTTFRNNFEEYIVSTGQCVTESFLKQQELINAASLTVIYSQQGFTVNVKVTESIFINNYGVVTGAFMLAYYNCVTKSQALISHTAFKRNFKANSICGLGSSDLSLIYYAQGQNISGISQVFPLTVVDTTFSHNLKNRNVSFGTVLLYVTSQIQVNVSITFYKVRFEMISVTKPGLCILTYVYRGKSQKCDNVQVILDSITAVKMLALYGQDASIRFSSFYVSNIGRFIINGTSHYTGNYGSVFEIVNSDVILEGELHFKDNSAGYGAAFYMSYASRLILQSGLNAFFIRNSALYNGGAIFFSHITYESQCIFVPNAPLFEISMTFLNNSAVQSGNSIYSPNIYDCYAGNEYYNASRARNFLDKVSHGSLQWLMEWLLM